MDTKKTMNKFSAEVRGRAVRMVQEAETEATSPTKLTIPFAPRLLPRKGIAHAPAEHGTTRDTLLQVIARSCSWTDAVLAGNIASFD